MFLPDPFMNSPFIHLRTPVLPAPIEADAGDWLLME